jgi:glycosyltransferase involved in cell wall biosynthesis
MKQESYARTGGGLPVRNGGDVLEVALQSVLAQTFPAFELVIPDSASADRAETIYRTFAERNACRAYFHNERITSWQGRMRE